MWCNNCLLLFPLRSGTMVLASFIALYSIAGAVLIFLKGQFLYFTYPEPQIYGGISIAVGILAIVLLIAIFTNSYMWTRVLFMIGPFVLVLCSVRAGLMIFRLNYYQSNVIWECNHGGVLWNATIANSSQYVIETYENSTTVGNIPTGFCSSGFHSLYLAFAFALAIDLVLQFYLYFQTWRIKVWLEELYFSLKPGQTGGIYTA